MKFIKKLFSLVRRTGDKMTITTTDKMVFAMVVQQRKISKLEEELAAWKVECREMRDILLCIHSARIAMDEKAVIGGLERIDAYFREPNYN